MPGPPVPRVGPNPRDLKQKKRKDARAEFRGELRGPGARGMRNKQQKKC